MVQSDDAAEPQVNLTTHVDAPAFAAAMAVVDPAHYYERLSRLPKQAVLSSDDEFMMMDWSNIWYDEMPGENHLLIAQDSEHSLATGPHGACMQPAC